MAPEARIEREARLSAWPGYSIPDLVGVRAGVGCDLAAPIEFDTVYHDTADLRLIRRGVTLRRRRHADDITWTLELAPSGAPEARNGGRPRHEFDIHDSAETPPGDLVRLVRGWVRTEPLVAVATLHTARRRLRVTDASGQLAEVDDDEISVLDGDHVAARFREIEVEVLDGGDHALLDAIVQRLRHAGAGAPDGSPTLVRAVGPRALAPPELVVPFADRHSSLLEAVRAAVAEAVGLVVDHDVVVRLDDDPEGIHQARVGTRRLRSILRTFGPVLDEPWRNALRDELAWLADELGEVRDLDVLLARLHNDVATLPEDRDRAAGASLLEPLAARREAARAQLIGHLDDQRYVELLDHLVDAAGSPRVVRRADRFAAEVIPRLIARPWRKLQSAVAVLGAEPTDQQLHGIRILVKRARYAADVGVPVMGRPARRMARRLADAQDVLGDQHDAIIAIDVVRELASRSTPEHALVAGQLIAMRRAASATGRDEWQRAWAAIDRDRVVGWLS